MHVIKVLGSGCRNCVRTAKIINDLIADQAVDAIVEKVEDLPSIMSYGVMSTPGVVIDGEVVHAGGVPSRKQVLVWLQGLDN